MTTHESYVSEETAKLLKDAGFDWNTNYCYELWDEKTFLMSFFPDGRNHNSKKYGLSAPTLAVAQRWLRETFKLHVFVEPFIGFFQYICDYIPSKEEAEIANAKNEFIKVFYHMGRANTYEDALEEGIQKCLTMLIEQK